ncbi:glycosyl transferase [Streptomyces spiroverticillatus]|uniref:Glycosyl transferase n=1 Tax=Streptomyces finlayi TaxID=67296 RepID=A0A918WXW6_9ACTN|nr:glycosyl transferase [Streptomyces spiroverticillatus]GHC94474.1 glycosyl transferase [Streptomyces finlayi]
MTLVVPTYNVQGYLRECLDSVLHQDFTDFEILAVNDCSPDASGAILDEYAALDPRVRVVHLSENVGLGRARNVGMEHAHGEYLLFLDSDDTLTPGALGAIADRLEATKDPDVLVFDYDRTHWDGKSVRNLLHEHLRKAEASGAFPLTRHPELLDLLQVVWNKAYRREFVIEHGFTFPPGYYEDAPWTFCSLMTAENIATLHLVCVHYRQRREGGNILRTTSRKHFDVFDQYDRVFAYLDATPALELWRADMFRKMTDHYLTILEHPNRLPREARSEFFQRAAADYQRREPAGFVRPGGSRGHKYQLMGRGSYSGLRGVKTVAKARSAAKQHGRRQVTRAKRSVMGVYYHSQLRLPLDENLAVFSSYWSSGYACNPAAIDAALAEWAPHIRRVWVVKPRDRHRVPDGVDVVLAGSREYWAAVARAKYMVNNVNFANAVVKREGQIHLQTHHGTPLKAMGLDQQKYPAGATMDFEALMERCDRWDFSITSNRFSTAVWDRVYPCSYTAIETGYPRNDILLNATAADVLRARRALGLADGTTAVLYAPTHRDYEHEFVPRLNLEQLAEELGTDFTVLVRGHYFYRHTTGDTHHGDARIVDVSGHPEVEQLYLAADALVTDYSSSMFDYANLDRPIVALTEDWAVYSAVRGTYFDLPKEAPGAVAGSQQELTEIFRSGAWCDDEAARRRAAFRERFCDFDDGHAAERVVRRVFLGEAQEALPPVVPLAERKPAPSPSTLLLNAVPSPRGATTASGPRSELLPG